MEWWPCILEFAEELEALSERDIAFTSVYYGGQIAAALFAARTIVIVLARKTGLYHPDHYRLWPRPPWRAPFRAWLALKNWYERVFLIGKRATGGFAGLLATLTLPYTPGKLLMGRAYGFGFGLLQPIGIRIKRHLFIYAMTGAGKTTALIATLSAWRGSAIVIDTKAQVEKALAHHDPRTWCVIDPYGISSSPTACFNVFDIVKDAIKADPKLAVLWATRIAEALIITPALSRSPFFTNVPRNFLGGLILHIITYHPEDCHHLPFTRDLILRGYTKIVDADGEIGTGDDAFNLLLRVMQSNEAFDGFISGSAAAFASACGETGGNITSTMQDETKWLDNPAIRDVLRKSTFRLSDFKTRDDCVLALTAPVSSIREELNRFTRLLTNMTAYMFEATPNSKKKGQCLFVVDELPSQGYNPIFEVMLAVLRSYGLTFAGIAVNTELMKRHYPQSWKSFSGEADAVLWMGCNHPDSAEHLSGLLGQKTIKEKDRYTRRTIRKTVSVMDQEQCKRFLDPDSGNLIVTCAGKRALKLKSEPYFKALPVWRYAADPEFRETLLRRISRWLFVRKKSAAARSQQLPDIDHEPDSAPEPSTKTDSENIIDFPKQALKPHQRSEENTTP